ncbi:MAG: hypothetical protein ACFB0A_02015 [Croceivirga sp.]
MKKIPVLLFGIALLAISFGENKKVDKSQILNDWEFKMISQGKNKPNFNPNKDSLKYIPVLLHKGYDLEEIRSHFQWTHEELKTKVSLLSQANFIKKGVDNKMMVSMMVISEGEGEKISKYLTPVSEAITNKIKGSMDSIQHNVAQIECLKHFDFNDISLLVLSNILLDNGQIKNVELEYLQKERPNRNNKKYYASFQEKPTDSEYEALGIYGNQVEMKEGFALCRYGNQRYLPEVIEMANEIELQYLNISKTSSFKYPIITSECSEDLLKVSGFFKPDLLEILNQYDTLLRAEYNKSLYRKELSYEEFFIWIYHILYTDVTDRLIADGLILIPKEKVAFYIFQP